MSISFIELLTLIAIITPYIIWYLNWRKNRIKTIKPDPVCISAFVTNGRCMLCCYFRDQLTHFICLNKKGKIPLDEIKEKHSCYKSFETFAHEVDYGG